MRPLRPSPILVLTLAGLVLAVLATGACSGAPSRTTPRVTGQSDPPHVGADAGHGHGPGRRHLRRSRVECSHGQRRGELGELFGWRLVSRGSATPRTVQETDLYRSTATASTTSNSLSRPDGLRRHQRRSPGAPRSIARFSATRRDDRLERHRGRRRRRLVRRRWTGRPSTGRSRAGSTAPTRRTSRSWATRISVGMCKTRASSATCFTPWPRTRAGSTATGRTSTTSRRVSSSRR